MELARSGLSRETRDAVSWLGGARIARRHDRPTNSGLPGRERGRFAKKSRDTNGDYRQVRQAIGWKTGTTGRDGRFGSRAVFFFALAEFACNLSGVLYDASNNWGFWALGPRRDV